MNDTIVTLLKTIPFASLATVDSQGTPLATIITTSYRDGCLYWFSVGATDHSRNIEANKHVSVVIYDQSRKQKDVVYIESTAEIVDKTDSLYDGLFPDQATRAESMELYRVQIGTIDAAKSHDDRHYFKGTTV